MQVVMARPTLLRGLPLTGPPVAPERLRHVSRSAHPGVEAEDVRHRGLAQASLARFGRLPLRARSGGLRLGRGVLRVPRPPELHPLPPERVAGGADPGPRPGSARRTAGPGASGPVAEAAQPPRPGLGPVARRDGPDLAVHVRRLPRGFELCDLPPWAAGRLPFADAAGRRGRTVRGPHPRVAAWTRTGLRHAARGDRGLGCHRVLRLSHEGPMHGLPSRGRALLAGRPRPRHGRIGRRERADEPREPERAARGADDTDGRASPAAEARAAPRSVVRLAADDRSDRAANRRAAGVRGRSGSTGRARHYASGDRQCRPGRPGRRKHPDVHVLSRKRGTDNPGPADRRFHPPDYVLRHGADAFSRRVQCSECHSAQAFCLTCHEKEGIGRGGTAGSPAFHDAEPNWLIVHGRAARQNMETCTSCHQQSSCLRCHSAKFGFRIDPHGPGFDPNRIADRSTISCGICHFSIPKGGGGG